MFLRAMFWRFACKRYGGISVSPMFEYIVCGWIVLLVLIFGAAAIGNPQRTIELLPYFSPLVIVPLLLAMGHMRIRKEQEKGRFAINEKMHEVTGGRYRKRRRRRHSPRASAEGPLNEASVLDNAE